MQTVVFCFLKKRRGLASSVECWYQEAGRAGRDGLPSFCVSLFADSDRNTLLNLASSSTGTARDVAIRGIDEMMALATSRECRRKVILAKFGEVSDIVCFFVQFPKQRKRIATEIVAIATFA